MSLLSKASLSTGTILFIVTPVTSVHFQHLIIQVDDVGSFAEERISNELDLFHDRHWLCSIGNKLQDLCASFTGDRWIEWSRLLCSRLSIREPLHIFLELAIHLPVPLVELLLDGLVQSSRSIEGLLELGQILRVAEEGENYHALT